MDEQEDRSSLEADVRKLKMELERSKERNNLYRELKEHRETVERMLELFQRDVDSEIRRNVRFFRLGSIAFVVVTLFSIFAASFAIYQFTSSLAMDRLDIEFSQPRIQKVIQQAATTRASEIIEARITPAINQANATIEQLEGELSSKVDNLLGQYQKDLENLRQEVDYQKKLREIQGLQHLAMNGSYEAYASLERYESTDKSLKLAARSAALFTKGFYLTGTRVSGVEISKTLPDGTQVKNKKLDTAELIEFLLNDPKWEHRAKAASILGERKEYRIVEALLKSMNSDLSLDVRREALTAFERLTRFDANDVFAFQPAQKWYDEHREEVRTRLKYEEKDKGPS